MCNHNPREAAMTVIGPGVWCDPCLVPLVRALNEGGVPTIASCCGHGDRPGNIVLADKRELFIMPDRDTAERLHNAIAAELRAAQACPFDCDACHGDNCPCDRFGCEGSGANDE